MGKVLTHMTMSLDGFVAGPDDNPGELFDWYEAGDVSVRSANEHVKFEVDEASAEMLRELTDAGAIVSGRRLFDIAGGWDDSHPAGAPVVVVTHEPPADAAERWPKTTFVNGVEAAIAKAREIAGDKNVGVNGGQMARQCLDAGLLDEVHVDLVPVLLGGGTPFFSELGTKPVQLEGPTSVVEGTGVTHIAYAVPGRRSSEKG